jgi:hypothetical protein
MRAGKMPLVLRKLFWSELLTLVREDVVNRRHVDFEHRRQALNRHSSLTIAPQLMLI